jgi:putative endonuclease
MYAVYIMASWSRVIYIGITGNLEERVQEHKSHKYPDSFTSKYKCTRLVYVENFDRIEDALARENQLKGWRRSKKITLIQALNPHWDDLADPQALPGPSLRSG